MIALRHYDGINNTPALRLAVEGWRALNLEFPGEEVLNVNWDHQAIAAFDGVLPYPLGVLTWSHIAWTKQVFVQLSYVLPVHRRRGIYRTMWDALVVKAAEKKAATILSSTSINNVTMRAVAARFDRHEVSVTLCYVMPMESAP